jgi:hypothetical protein
MFRGEGPKGRRCSIEARVTLDTKSLLVHYVSIDVHTALSTTENMLRNGSLGNGGATDCNLGAFPLSDVLVSAIPVFSLAV